MEKLEFRSEAEKEIFMQLISKKEAIRLCFEQKDSSYMESEVQKLDDMLDELEHHLPERWMKELTRTHKRTCKSLRRIFKGTSNTYINFIYNISNRPLYNVFLWVKCWISTYYCSWNCLCRCSSNFRLRNRYGTLGNFIWIKWRFKIRFSNNWLMDYYVCN